MDKPPLQVGNLDAVPQNARWVAPTDKSLAQTYEAEQAAAVETQAQAQGGGATT